MVAFPALSCERPGRGSGDESSRGVPAKLAHRELTLLGHLDAIRCFRALAAVIVLLRVSQASTVETSPFHSLTLPGNSQRVAAQFAVRGSFLQHMVADSQDGARDRNNGAFAATNRG